MSCVRFLLAALLTVGIATAHAPCAAAQTPTADEKELASYRLTMPTVRKVAAATRAFMEEAARDPKVMERDKLKARLEALQDKEELTDADNAEMEKLQERLQALEEAIDAANPSVSNQTLAGMAAELKKHPAAMRALAREGLTPREYTRCMMALLQAAMVEGFSEGKVDLGTLPAGINPENIRFIRENKAELEAMQKSMTPPKK